MEKPKFPTHIFPKPITDFFEEIQEKNGFDPAYLSGAYLAILSTILGTNYKVYINDRWSLHPTIWLALVGDSGTKKTPSIKPITAALKRINDIKYTEYLVQKTIDNEEDKDIVTPPKQILIQDTTYEALINALENNPKGVLLQIDELRSLFEESNQLSKSLTKLLSIFNNEPISINRKTNGEYIKIDKPFMSILGGIQTNLFEDLLKGGRLDSGFAYRFLFVQESERKTIGTLENIDRSIEKKFEDFLTNLININKTTTEIPINIKLSEEAKNRFTDWRTTNHNKMVNTTIDSEKGYLSKMEAYVVKFALLIEVSDSIATKVSVQQITDYSIERAIELSNYFITNFMNLINSTNNKKAIETANKEIRKKCVDKAMSKLNAKSKKEICKELSSEGVKNCDIAKSLSITKGGVSQYISK